MLVILHNGFQKFPGGADAGQKIVAQPFRNADTDNARNSVIAARDFFLDLHCDRFNGFRMLEQLQTRCCQGKPSRVLIQQPRAYGLLQCADSPGHGRLVHAKTPPGCDHTPGLMGRTVEDVAFAFAALEPGDMTTPKPAALPGLRLGVPANLFWDGAEPSIAALVKTAVEALNAYGAQTVDCTLPGCEEVLSIFYEGGLAAPELRSFMLMHFPDRIDALDPTVRRRVQGSETMTSDEYLRRRRLLPRYGQAALSVFADCDVLITPTVAISPPEMADIADIEPFHNANMMALRNTAVANLFGWCALTLPVGLDGNGMPVGLQLMAPPYKEESLLGIGLAVEKALRESFAARQRMETIADACLKNVKTRKEKKDARS